MGATEGLGEGSSASSALPPPPALQRLRGPADLAGELAELERERAACQGRRARRPWELFRDRALRRQVASLVVLGGVMELCGNDAVSSPRQAQVAGERGGGRGWSGVQEGDGAPRPLAPPPHPTPTAGVRLCVSSVQPGADSPREGPVRLHRDRGLRAAGGAAQRESASGMTPHPPALRRTLAGAGPRGAGPPGTAGLGAKPLTLQVAMLKYGELASAYRAPSLPGTPTTILRWGN